MIKKIPYPIAGLILSLFALGNLLSSYSSGLRLFLGGIGFVLYVIYLIKIFSDFQNFKEEMKNPVVAGVFATFPMATMLLATYIKAYIPFLAFPIWVLGIVIQILLIFYYIKTFVIKKDIKLVFPTWFIVFVGIVVASVTSGAFDAFQIGKFTFYFGLVCYIILIPVVSKRIFSFKNIPEPAFATVVIFTAPGGLLLAGYMSAFSEKNISLVYLLMAVSFIIYIYSLSQLPAVLKQPPMPSISAITFPTVITAIGFKMSNAFFVSMETPIPFLIYIVKFMELVATICVLIACYRYFKIITKKES